MYVSCLKQGVCFDLAADKVEMAQVRIIMLVLLRMFFIPEMVIMDIQKNIS